MVRTLSLTAVVSIALLLSGCKDDHQSLQKKLMSKMEDARDVLKDVKDKSSADAAVGKLKSLSADVQDINKRMGALPAPTEEEAKKMLESPDSPLGKLFAVLADIGKEEDRIQGAGLMTPELKAAIGTPGGPMPGFPMPGGAKPKIKW